MQVSIIIVSYNSAKFIQKCLNSILEQTNVTYEIIIIDNNSSDDTVSVIRNFCSNLPDVQVKLIANSNNIGFSRANNQGFSEATGQYIFLLNPDAIFSDKKALANLVAYLKQKPQCGLLGSQIIDIATDKEDLPKTEYFHQKFCPEIFANLPGEIAWVLGASCLIPRKVFEEINGFSDEFFMYGDDLDICLRIRKKGYTIEYCKQAAVYHIGGGCEDQTNPYAKWVRKQHGIYTFAMRHYPIDSIIKIAKHQRAIARRQRLLKSLLGLLPTVNVSADKIQRYRAVCDTTKRIIRDPKSIPKLLELINVY